MGNDKYNFDFECTPEQYQPGLVRLWNALGNMNPTNEDVFTLAARAIEEAHQRPSRREIAAMAMQGLLSNPTFGCPKNVAAQEAVKYADALIERLNADPVAEGLNLLPMYSRELDEGLTDVK
jgi:chloramphenicol 3-O-phosphotransferase